MGFHNPFLKDGLIRFPDNGNLVRHVEKWAKVRGDNLAYQFIDFSTERDGVARNLSWADFSARNKAVGARLQQVTQPGDRVAILCPQNLDYLVGFFGVAVRRPHRRTAVRPVRARTRRPPARRPRRLPTHRDPHHHRLRRGRPQVLPHPASEGTPPRHRRGRGARRGRCHLGAGGRHARHHRVPAVHVRLDPHPDRRADHPPQPGDQHRPGHRGHRWRRGRPRRHLAAVLPRHGSHHGDDLAGRRPLHHVHDAGRVRPQARSLDSRDGPQGRRHRWRHLRRAELCLRPRRGAGRAQGWRTADWTCRTSRRC